ncbi:MAG: anti-sigma factor family protein [Acidimicrobiales bacterium]
MSDDRTAELLSAYLDGEATPEEVARVEADPALLAEAEALRSVAERLGRELPPVPASLRRGQVAAALDLFDQLEAGRAAIGDPGHDGPFPSVGSGAADGPVAGSSRGGEAGPVVDLGSRRHRSGGRLRGLPGWLGAAAALVLVAGGIGWVASQSGSDETASETAAVEAEDTSGDDGGGSATDRATSGLAEGAPAPAEGSADDGADGSDMAGEETATLMDDEAATTTAASGDDAATDGASDTGARLVLPAPPAADEIPGLVGGELADVSESDCGGRVAGPDGGELVGFVPISVAGVDGEVLVYLVDGERSGLAVDRSCQPFG